MTQTEPIKESQSAVLVPATKNDRIASIMQQAYGLPEKVDMRRMADIDQNAHDLSQ